MTRLAYFDEDWDEIRTLLTAWWRHEKPHRPILSITAPRETPIPCPAAPPHTGNPRTDWLDVDANLRRYEAGLARTYQGGCSFPYITPNLGPGNLNLYLGSQPVFMPQTIWYKPVFDDPAKAVLRLDPENEYWQWTLKAISKMKEAGRGKFLVGIPDLIEGIDILSELLGTQELLTYLIDCPDEIHRLLNDLDPIYWQAFDPLYDRVKDERNGNAFIAFQVWGPGRTIKSQCDFSAMISPDMFAEFVCPYLERQCARADFSVFHVDGPKCIPHLEHLLKVKSLTAIQWTPGFPNPACADPVWWKPVWEKVYAAGKSALVLGNPAHMVEPFLKEFGLAGSFLSTSTQTEREARQLLKDAQHWG
jgi:5-methyltetrahydrofolate--homocysteine methyltransferase